MNNNIAPMYEITRTHGKIVRLTEVITTVPSSGVDKAFSRTCNGLRKLDLSGVVSVRLAS